MNRDQIERDDFPAAVNGYDRASVEAHLTAVAVWTDSLQAQITALEVERDALRRQTDQPDRPADGLATEPALISEPASEPEPAPVPAPGPAGGTEAKMAPRPESADSEVSARLVATRLALEGSGRDEIVAKLADTYELEDPAAIADDVLKRIG